MPLTSMFSAQRSANEAAGNRAACERHRRCCFQRGASQQLSFHQSSEEQLSSLNTIHVEPKYLDNSHVSTMIETERMKAFCPLRQQEHSQIHYCRLLVGLSKKKSTQQHDRRQDISLRHKHTSHHHAASELDR